MKKLKNKKVIIPLVIVILITIGLLIYFFTGRNEFKVGETLKIEIASDYLVKYDNGDYYLMKANADIKFKVTSEDKEVKYKIVDEEGNVIDSKVSKKNDIFTIAAKKNYKAGKTYKITLENATFTDKKLKDIKELYFTIVRPNSNTQVLNDNVIKVKKDTITSVQKDDNYYTLVSKKEFKKDDILYYQNKNDVLAFKVDEVKLDNGNYTIKTSSPTLDELFKELDIYGEFNLDINDFISDEDLKKYITIAVSDGLFDDLIPDVKAESIFNIDIDKKKDGSVKITVGLLLTSGDNTIFEKTLKNHDIKLDIEFSMRIKALSDLTHNKQDLGAHLEIEMGTDFKIANHDDTFFAYKQELSNGSEFNITAAKEKLDKTELDNYKKNKTIGKVTIPTPILGLNVNFEIDLIKDFEVALEAALGTRSEIGISFGYNNKGFYHNFDINAEETGFNILGKGEFELGFEPKINVSFLGMLEAGTNAKLGLYGEGQINYMNSSNNEEELDGNFEIGTFINAGLYGEYHIWKISLAKAEISLGIKIPIFKLEGNLSSDNNDLSMYAGTYRNMYGGTKEIYIKDGKLYYDTGSIANEVDFNNKKKDGSIIIYEDKEFAFSAAYLYPVGVNFSAVKINQDERVETDNTKIRLFTQGSGVSGIESVYYKVDENGSCEDKLLTGDFSCYAGTYEGQSGDSTEKLSLVLSKDGKISTEDGKPASIKKMDDGTIRLEYMFYFDTPDSGSQLTSQYYYIAPVGTKMSYYTIYDHKETDTSKIRIKKEGFITADSNEIYYKK